MANLRTNNLSGEQGQNAYRGSVVFGSDGIILQVLRIEDNSELDWVQKQTGQLSFGYF